MERTQYKLAEAKFFLKHLEEHWRHVPQIDFYLSACISSARSVTWVMKSEFGKMPGWQSWFDEKKPSRELRELLKSMNDVRVRLTKHNPVKTITTADLEILAKDATPDVIRCLQNSHSSLVQLEPIDKNNTVFNIKIDGNIITKGYLKSADHHIKEFPGQDAKDVCKKYINELEILVNECINKFSR